MLLALLLACPAPTPDDTAADTAEDTGGDTGEQVECAWDAPERNELAWDEIGTSGVSAEDVFGFAAGPFTAPSHWDDATTTDLTVTVTPGVATESVYGDPALCPVMLDLAVTLAFTTADGRLALALPATWSAEDVAPDMGDIGSVSTADDIDPTDAGLAPQDAASAFGVRLQVGTDGELSFVVEERWALDEVTTRQCVRVSLDAESLGCADYVDEPVD